jgi:hypothetical protein
VGYPKSGNTWFQELVSAVVYGVMPAYAPLRLCNELVPDVHFRTFYQRFHNPTFFKTHHLPRPEYKRVVYLLRDGRDVMVSYFHFIAAIEQRPPDFLSVVRNGVGLFPCKWHKHVEAWLANPYRAAIVVIRYEDLKKDTAAELGRFCEFVGLQRDPAFIREMARASTFEKMREKERSMGMRINPCWPTDKLFRRRGEVGSFREEMPPEVLDAFMQEAGATLSKLGFPP